jgi:chromosome segregation ATPase
MGEDQGQERAQLVDDQDKSAAQLRAEIEDVREDLGDTAAALAAKTDVKARAREKAQQLKQSAADTKDDLLSKTGRARSANGASRSSGPAALTQARTKARENPGLVAAVGALVGGFALGRLTRRRG